MKNEADVVSMVVRRPEAADPLARFQPANLQEAMEVAKMLAQSVIIPRHLIGKPGDVLATIIAGAELGLKVMQALRAIYMVNGKVGFYADFLQAKCQEHPKCRRFEFVPEKSDATRATFIAEREGQEPKEYEYNIAMAQRGGLTKNDTYRAHPEAMLRARCVSALAKIVFPEVTFGLYSKDEMHEIEERAVDRGEAQPEEKELNPPPTGSNRTQTVTEHLQRVTAPKQNLLESGGLKGKAVLELPQDQLELVTEKARDWLADGRHTKGRPALERDLKRFDEELARRAAQPAGEPPPPSDSDAPFGSG